MGKTKTNELLDKLLDKQPVYFSYDMLKSQLKAKNASVADSTLKSYMSRLVADNSIYDAGKGWYSNIREKFNLDTEPLKELIEVLNKSFPLLGFSCWSTEQINLFTHHMLGRHISFVYTDSDAVDTVTEVLLDNGYNAYSDPQKNDIEKYFRPIEKTVIIRPLKTKEPETIDGAAPVEKIMVDLIFENQRFNFMSQEEAQEVIKKASDSGRISVATLVSYAERRSNQKIEWVEKINQVQKK